MSELDAALTARLEGLIAEAPGGAIAVAARHVDTGAAVSLRPEEVFPAASAIKVAILVELYAQAEEGRLALAEELPLLEEEKVPGSGVLKELHVPRSFTLEDLARLMIVISDNTASNMLIDRLSPAAINARMQALGMPHSCLQRRFFDYEARQRGLDNLIAAGDLAELYLRMERRELVSTVGSEAMLAILKRQQVSSKIPRLLPPDTEIAHKTGTINDASHDAGIIYAPAGPIVLVVLTKGYSEVDGETVIRRVARAVYDAWGTA